MGTSENDTDGSFGLLQRLKKAITGVEKSNRWIAYPRRINVILETDRDYNVSSHTNARAYKLTDDELLIERNARRLNQDSWKSFERSRIVKADVTGGETIIAERGGGVDER